MFEHATVRVPHHVVHRAFAVETVMLNVNSGTYHGLNPVGGRMFAVLLEAATVGAAVDALAAEFGVPRERVAADVHAFVTGLAERGLVEVRDGAGA